MNLNLRIIPSLIIGVMFCLHGIAHAESRGMRQWYAAFKPKGAVKAGIRVTILTGKTSYKVGESVEIIHVLEVIEPGLYIGGEFPKQVYDEYVDGKLVSKKEPSVSMGGLKNVKRITGIIRKGPTTDYDYVSTTYTFDKPGTHTIQWKPDGRISNLITLRISEK